MLVLSRREGESITFPELGVEIRVVGLRKSKVQLGIEAPREITVSRGEQADRVPMRSECSLVDQQRADHQIAELVRLEAELIELAELAERTDSNRATEIAGDAIERIAGIKRSVRLASHSLAEPKSISELVTVRTDVIDTLRIGQTEEVQRGECVRQRPAGYAVLSPSCSVA